MSITFASGQMRNMTPRQTAGAAGPKSVRNVMTGRTPKDGTEPDMRRSGAGRRVRRRFDGVSTGRAGRRDPPSRSGMCWSVRAGRTPVAGTEPARPGQLAQEEQLIDLAQRPADLVDRDATHEGGQIGRFLRAESLHQ